MCGRFNIISDPLTRLLLEITGMEYELQDRFNIAPTEDIPVVLQDQDGTRTLQQKRWWLVPKWADEPSTKYSMFNARSEGLLKNRAFSQPFKSSRCLVPVSGYYEWQKGETGKIPFYIKPEVGDGFARGAMAARRVPGSRPRACLWDGGWCSGPARYRRFGRRR